MTIIEFLTRAPATSKQIQAATKLTQSAVSRQLRELGDRIVILGRSRPPIYAATRNAFGGDDFLPLYMIDRSGDAFLVAMIRPLAHGGFFVEPTTGSPGALAGESMDGVYDDLPYFLQDLRPQGFLGRHIASELASVSDEFPADPKVWTTSHIGRYLVSNGDDLPGNFKFGRHTYLRPRHSPIASIIDDYPRIAENVLSGQAPGSSAGGEQPKFTAFSRDREEHVIVKFSPANDDSTAARWCDILITELHATEALHAASLPAAETRLLEIDGQLFLESVRFDRSGEYGRLPMISLQAVDAEYVGLGENWSRVMWRLTELNLVNFKHAIDAEMLWHFGRLINNSDMHLGNLSLGIDGDVFSLLPVYDMCSMGFAPTNTGVRPYRFSPPTISISEFCSEMAESLLERLQILENDFWVRVQSDDRISDEFRNHIDSRLGESDQLSIPGM